MAQKTPQRAPISQRDIVIWVQAIPHLTSCKKVVEEILALVTVDQLTR